ncbi:hypothetical protein [Streptomyces europaeiscabiei]|uniref:hypothetical protein n=1 Tax=Streptomyces europaeiscabiei TaxID=146819 RepID=UPI0029BDEA1C|nr:hypothetical protein [Streptomyces europaeiscabiei]MDX3841242.1 hypothetical protein [Streptomyces europaeiscabiei]
MFFRRARANRAFREAQRAGYALLQQMHAEWPLPDHIAGAVAPAASQAPVPDVLPPDLRVPSRQEPAGLMMRWEQPLVIDGEIRTCHECGVYRDWIVFCMRDDSVWLHCRAGHEAREPRLDAAWYNRNSSPVDQWHPTLEDGLRHLGH